MTSGLRQSILNLIANGLTDKQIAQRLGVTRNSVVGHRYRAGVEGNRSPEVVATKAAKKGAGQKFPTWNGGIGARQATVSPFRTCQYLHGEALKRDFCGKPTCKPESSYCGEHHTLTHTRAPLFAEAAQ